MATGDIPLPVRLLLAGASSCIAATITNVSKPRSVHPCPHLPTCAPPLQPIDVIKVRLQLNGELNAAAAAPGGWLAMARRIVAHDGVPALWRGVVPSLMREGSYSALRIGLYEPVKVVLRADHPTAPYVLKLAAGGVSGCVGAAVATPTDLVKIRLQAQAGVPGARLRVRDVFRHVWRHEGGAAGLWQVR
jgi:hypothetical protein